MSSYPFLRYQNTYQSAYVPPSFENHLEFEDMSRQRQRLGASNMGIEMSEKPFSVHQAQRPAEAVKQPAAENKIREMAEKLSKPSESLAFLEMYHKSALKVE